MKKRSILIFPNGGLGDLAQISSLFQQAKTALPEASVQVCVYSRRYREALAGHPYLDGQIFYRLPAIVPGRPWGRGAWMRTAWFNLRLFRRYSDVFLAIPSLADHSAFAWPFRLGKARRATISPPGIEPLVLTYQKEFARFLEIDFVYHPPSLHLTEAEKDEGRRFLAGQTRPGRVPVFLSYDAGNHDRLLPASVAADFADRLDGLGCEVFLWRGILNPYHAAAIVNLARVRLRLVEGASIRRMMAIISACRLCISPNSGVSHIGAALGVPTIVLFGPTSLRFRPLENHVQNLSKATRCPYKKGTPDSDCEHSPIGQGKNRIRREQSLGPQAPESDRCIHPEAGLDAAACMYWFSGDDLIPAIKALDALKLD